MMKKIAFLWVGISLLSILACTKNEEKIASMEENLINTWQLENVEKNGESIEIEAYKKEALWDFQANHKFRYSYTKFEINNEDTTTIQVLSTFDWKISEDRDWIQMTHGSIETTTIHGQETFVETETLGTNGDYNMEILTLETGKLKVKVKYKDSEDQYTYTFRPQ